MKSAPFTIDAEIWRDLAARLEPRVRAAAHKAATDWDLDPDCCAQELKIRLARAFESYDYNASRGRFVSFANTVIHNEVRDMVTFSRRLRRAPGIKGEDGTTVSINLCSLEQLGGWSVPDGQRNQELSDALHGGDLVEEIEDRELYRRSEGIKCQIEGQLSASECQVFWLMVRPSEKFRTFLANTENLPGPKAYAEFLGVNKGAVDWKIRKIRMATTRVLDRPENQDLIASALERGEWPAIHLSKVVDDREFVRELLEIHSLDPRPVGVATRTGEGCSLVAEQYHWGMVVIANHKIKGVTLLIRGNVSLNRGTVWTECGTRSIQDVVPWWRHLMSELDP